MKDDEPKVVIIPSIKNYQGLLSAWIYPTSWLEQGARLEYFIEEKTICYIYLPQDSTIERRILIERICHLAEDKARSYGIDVIHKPYLTHTDVGVLRLEDVIPEPDDSGSILDKDLVWTDIVSVRDGEIALHAVAVYPNEAAEGGARVIFFIAGEQRKVVCYIYLPNGVQVTPERDYELTVDHTRYIAEDALLDEGIDLTDIVYDVHIGMGKLDLADLDEEDSEDKGIPNLSSVQED